jgi:hypothetical protein
VAGGVGTGFGSHFQIRIAGQKCVEERHLLGSDRWRGRCCSGRFFADGGLMQDVLHSWEDGRAGLTKLREIPAADGFEVCGRPGLCSHLLRWKVLF